MTLNYSKERFEEAARFLGIDAGISFKTVKSDRFCVEKKGNGVRIEYFRPVQVFRALALVKAESGDFTLTENPYLKEMGYMADAARDAVPKISALKKLALNLALFGYNRLYIYLEDVFSVEGEPFSGYLRGRYNREELKSLDEYCAGLGIELVPCIQTLAHLSTIFRWDEYKKIRDANDILLIGDERTYKYIDNVFAELSKTFASKTVHAGLDEAYMVGLGEYLAKNGYRDRFDIMTEHIGRVMNIAEKYGFNLQMWSDMFFSVASRQYCNEGECLPEDKLVRIPVDIDLVYWNYYKSDYNDYAAALKNHKKLRNRIAFAGGAWKWSGFTPSNKVSIERTRAAFAACKDNGIEEMFLTGWGDDGAEASLFSTQPVLAVFAQMNYAGSEDADKVFKAVCGSDMSDFTALDLSVLGEKYKDTVNLPVVYKSILYNDPLYGSMDIFFEHLNITEKLKTALGALQSAKSRQNEYGYIFDTAEALCEVAVNKCDLSLRIKKHYSEGNREALEAVAQKEIPELIKKVKKFYVCFRTQWEKENSSFGFEVHDGRIGGVILRLENTARILSEYLNGEREIIEELEVKSLHLPEKDAVAYGGAGTYKEIHTVNIS